MKTSSFSTLLVALLAGCSAPQSRVTDRCIDLPLPEALPYALLAEKERRNNKIHLTARECDRLYFEVYGRVDDFDPPRMPPPWGPRVVKDRESERIVANYTTTNGVLFEVAFAPWQPPRVESTCFTDHRHQSRFSSIEAAIRFRYEQSKRIDDLVSQSAPRPRNGRAGE